MSTLTTSIVRYAPPSRNGVAPAIALGRAFQRTWHERSSPAERQLRESILRLVQQFRSEGLTPEAAVIAFKRTILLFGGVHAYPHLALEHNGDGEDCASAYTRAFTQFVETYFSAAATKPSRT